MARDFFAKGPDDEVVAAGEDIEELIENLEEQAGLKSAEEYLEDYNGF